ncbi:MAG TPA: methyltransferase domain-containing protein [Ktedonobacteraceae bacterium]|nr:methyltransferase domain-containing protein [Ktedonobacteraceae bacterium]
MNMQEPKTNIAGLYNRVASLYGQVGPDFFSFAARHLVERMNIGEGAKVLDVAVGRGANLFAAAEKVGPDGQVIGIDLAENMVQETKAEIERRNISNATALQMDAEGLRFDRASFDDVLCGFAIFLFPHLDQALSEFFRVLRPGGKIGITVARDVDALSLWYGRRITEYHERYHFPLSARGEGFNIAEIPAYLTRAGFMDVQVLHEQAKFDYADAQQWWDEKWTHGTRYSLEHMSPEVLTQFKKEVFDRLEEAQKRDGIYEERDFQFIIATR